VIVYIAWVLSRIGKVIHGTKGLACLSVDNKQFRTDLGKRTMRFRIVRDLIAYAWFEHVSPTVFQFSFEMALNTEDYVALGTPMIREIAGRVLNHANADAAEVPSAPIGHATLAFVFGLFNLRPVRDSEGNARNLHK